MLHTDPPTATLEEVIVTPNLAQRPSRPPDYQAESRALCTLAQKMSDDPQSLLRALADLALELCSAHSAGISLLPQSGDAEGDFTWPALAGEYAPFQGGGTDRHLSPCGVCLHHNTHILYSYPARYFTLLQGNGPTIVESLVIPVAVEQQALGTIWVVSHHPVRQFDSEDARVLSSLANFTAAALKVLGALNAAQKSTLALAEAHEELEERVAERTQDLRWANHALEERDQTLQERMAEIEALNDRLKRAMLETHHRVKNNLQVIGALIDMQSMEYAADNQVPLTELQRLIIHIRALAVIHDLLTTAAREEESAQYLSVKTIVGSLMPMLQMAADGRQVQHSVEDIRLPSKHCTAIALLVNELVSNAIKYGMGDIQVEFSVAQGLARLSVSDGGIGFPEGFDLNMSANTGLLLVQSIASTDLGGCVECRNAEAGGAQAIVTFPLSAS